MRRALPSIMHTMKKLHTCFENMTLSQYVWLMSETFMNEKCVNVTKIKLKEVFVIIIMGT